MIRSAVKNMTPWLKDIRRDFHRHPELRFKETRTAEKIHHYLKGMGLSVKTGIGKTGLIGLYTGSNAGKTFALRADMDALPIQEETGCAYASLNEGIMHACGHDAHITISLGTARALTELPELRKKIRGHVKFIFQPGEEGGHGAREMIADGVLEDPRVDTIVATHVAPLMPIGNVGIYLREACASADSFNVRIIGKGAHAAYPHLSRDPILGGAQVISGLQSLVSRDTDPTQGLVVSVTRVEAGTATNIIPEEMSIAGTIRALKLDVRRRARGRFEELVQGVCQGYGLQAEIKLGNGYPPMTNHEEVSRLIAEVASGLVGEAQVLYPEPKFGSEDFAYFLEKCPGAGFELGCGNKAKGIVHSLHTSRFDMDEDALPLGVELYLRLIESYFDGFEA